jgi:hypothetical protein
MLIGLVLILVGIIVIVMSPIIGLVPGLILITIGIVVGLLGTLFRGIGRLSRVGTTKRCPECRSQIPIAAVVCRYCGFRYG